MYHSYQLHTGNTGLSYCILGMGNLTGWEFVSPIGLFTHCRLEYIKLGPPSDLMWSEFPQPLTQMQGARRYVMLFESPFVGSDLNEAENNALRVSSLQALPPPPPDM